MAQVFFLQTRDDPAAFVARIADVKDFAGTFGVAIGGSKGGPGLAHWPGCAPD